MYECSEMYKAVLRMLTFNKNITYKVHTFNSTRVKHKEWYVWEEEEGGSSMFSMMYRGTRGVHP